MNKNNHGSETPAKKLTIDDLKKVIGGTSHAGLGVLEDKFGRKEASQS
jgi:bacteriocin-like protein